MGTLQKTWKFRRQSFRTKPWLYAATASKRATALTFLTSRRKSVACAWKCVALACNVDRIASTNDSIASFLVLPNPLTQSSGQTAEYQLSRFLTMIVNGFVIFPPVLSFCFAQQLCYTLKRVLPLRLGDKVTDFSHWHKRNLSTHRRDLFVEPNPNQIKVLANGHQIRRSRGDETQIKKSETPYVVSYKQSRRSRRWPINLPAGFQNKFKTRRF